MPYLRHRSAHFAPASCSVKMPMICSSVYLVRFIVRPFVGSDSNSKWRKNPVAGQQRKPDSVIHHSDQGSQYTSVAFGLRCKEMGVRPSMGSVGDCYDNAMCESFFATLECELLDRRKFRTKAEARVACFEFIEGWYNPSRRHSALGYKSPVNYERITAEGLESISP